MSMVSSDQVCHREPFNLGLLPRITLLLLNEPRGYSMEPMPRPPRSLCLTTISCVITSFLTLYRSNPHPLGPDRAWLKHGGLLSYFRAVQQVHRETAQSQIFVRSSRIIDLCIRCMALFITEAVDRHR